MGDAGHHNLTVRLGRLTLKNPIIAASGTFGFGLEYADIFDPAVLGGITLKGLTLAPRTGNPNPRIAETPAGMLNAIGLENPGVDAFLEQELPTLQGLGPAIIANIAGSTVDEYAEVARRLSVEGIDAIEVNISCPNVKKGGLSFGTDARQAASLVEAVREATEKPLIVKLSPNVTDIVELARAVVSAGADCLSLINTLLGMAIDIGRRRPVLANTFGGLSGPAIKPVALRMVWQVYEAVEVPLIGMGGIMGWQDAVEFLLAGASAVSVGTATFVNPRAMPDIIEGLSRYLRKVGGQSVSSLIGAAHRV